MTGRPAAVVVGGGISGLVAAWELGRAGFAVDVIEAGPRLGGPLRTVEVAGVVVDTGAEAFLARRPEALDLLAELGLDELLTRPVRSAPLIARDGGLLPLPAGTVFGVPGDPAALAGLLSPAEVARAHDEVDVAWAGDTSVAEFVGARLGPAVVDRVVDPMLGGVYAGSAAGLSAAATLPGLVAAVRGGSGLRAAVTAATRRGGPAPFAGLAGGVAGLIDALAAAVVGEGGRVHLAQAVTAVRRNGAGWAVATLGSGGRVAEHRVDVVVVAAPGPVTGRLLHDLAPQGELSQLELADVAVVVMAFHAAVVDPAAVDPAATDGTGGASGVLVPAVEGHARGLTVKALTFSSAKWGWVAAQDPRVTVVRASVGRAGEHAIHGLDDGRLVDAAVADLRALLPGRQWGSPVDTAVQRWPGSLPQYPVGHVEAVAKVMAQVDALPGLAVAGSWLAGVGIPACIATGRAAASKVVIDITARTSLAQLRGDREDTT